MYVLFTLQLKMMQLYKSHWVGLVLEKPVVSNEPKLLYVGECNGILMKVLPLVGKSGYFELRIA